MTRNQWGGRFASDAADELRRFNDSFAFDCEILAEDIEGSIQWAAALERAGVLTAGEAGQIDRALRELLDDAADIESLPIAEHEDVHSYVESRLREAVGDLAGKLHTGRSRNDQVATDFKLYIRRASTDAISLIAGVAETLASRAADEAATAMPGYTHLKQAEPVTFGHWCLAYVEMLLRDGDRFAAAMERGDECPLGSGALSGTPVMIDRFELARSLGFAMPTANSIDAVADRDFAAEYLFNAALLLSHLSRLAEDLVFFTSDEVAFAELPDSMATGSSRMPQKKNPDALELVRGHAGRAIGELVSLLALLKGLPLAYDKDMQLDKEPVFRMEKTLRIALPALQRLIEGLHLDRERMHAAASADNLLATTLADAIASRGIPFREAHEIVSTRVGEAIRAKKTLRELGSGGRIAREDLEAMTVENALARRAAIGGTAPERVAEAARAAAARIAKLTERDDE
ncbi:MAG TPA: argininosuccinate lyase [Thermoanaerobaculia bacterium]|nr:argininosuccinate lyase [Thermoanaerobaculia bacterium]